MEDTASIVSLAAWNTGMRQNYPQLSSAPKYILGLCQRPREGSRVFLFRLQRLQKQAPELMVRSLVSQLSQQCVKIPPILETLYSSCENGQRQPSLDSLLDVLKEMIHQFPQTYIVLDALDECTDRIELLGILESIAGWQLDELHLLVTSRKERDIEGSLECLVEDSNIICLQSKLVDQDIRSYVHQRLAVDKNLKKWQKDSDVVHDIETALMEGSQGM
jgi:hypothetical protein